MKKRLFRIIAAASVSAAIAEAVIMLCAAAILGDNMPALIASAVVSAALLFAAAVFAAKIISKNATRQIIEPINSVNLENIGKSPVCEELMPFMKRIESEQISKQEMEKIRREFSANVSHELKTPLTSIYGYAQMLNNGMAKEEDYHTFTKRIEKEASRLILLIEDIIKLSNLDESNEIPTPERIDLSVAAQETAARLKKAATDRNVQIFYSGNETFIDGSKTLLGELMFNIIDNAIKYNKDGGQVTVYVGTGPKGPLFAVKDTGIGIPEKDIDRIFERFYRVDKSHSNTVGGTGLGLSIVKHAAMCHDAEIEIKSELGKGTTVSVIFPAASK